MDTYCITGYKSELGVIEGNSYFVIPLASTAIEANCLRS